MRRNIEDSKKVQESSEMLRNTTTRDAAKLVIHNYNRIYKNSPVTIDSVRKGDVLVLISRYSVFKIAAPGNNSDCVKTERVQHPKSGEQTFKLLFSIAPEEATR